MWRSRAVCELGPEPSGGDHVAPAFEEGERPFLQRGRLSLAPSLPNDVRQIGEDTGLAIEVVRLLDRLEGLARQVLGRP